jgi:hypothetical protein
MASTDISGIQVAIAAAQDVSGSHITLPLPSSLAKAVTDLSGVVHSGADLLRHVPALAAAAQAVGGSGPEKLALVQRAAHTAVDLYVPADDRAPAHLLVDGVLPSVVRAVLDVSKGHVKIQDAAAAAVVEAVSSPATQAAAVGLLAQCLGCLLAPRPQAQPPMTAQAQPEAAK